MSDTTKAIEQTQEEANEAFRQALHEAFVKAPKADAKAVLGTLLAAASELALRQNIRRANFKIIADNTFQGVRDVLEGKARPE